MSLRSRTIARLSATLLTAQAAALLASPAAARAATARQEEEALRKAAGLHAGGRAGEAVATLRAWCLEVPSDGPRWLAAAGFLASRGEFEAGEEFAERSNGLLPDRAETYGLLGACRLLARKPLLAEATFRRGVERFPEDPEMWFQLGMACSENQKMAETGQAYGRALALRPDYPEARFWAGEVAFRLNRLPEAEAHLRAALRTPEVNPDAAWTLAEVLAREGKGEEAEAHFRRALGEGPDLSRIRAEAHYGMFLFERGREEEAALRLESATARWPGYRVAWNYLARCRQRLGRTEGALEALRRARSLQREDDREEESMLLSRLRDLHGVGK